MLPHDTHLDKIQVQKAATPESGRSTLEGVTAEMERSQPNAVLLEATGEDEADINAQRISALRILHDKLADDVVTPVRHNATIDVVSHNHKGASGSGSSRAPIDAPKQKFAKTKRCKEKAELIIPTGSVMMDQFQPWYFGVAFSFVFKFGVGMPDMQQFLEKKRHRRPEDAPRVEVAQWVQIMARRV